MDLNTIKCCDNVSGCEGLSDNSVDLVVTSPPYDDIREYKNNIKNTSENDGFSFPFKPLVNELFRVMKDGGVVVWVVGDATVDGSETGNSFRQALYFMEAGFKLHDTMIYEKNTSSFPAKRTGNRYTQIFEYMFVFSKGKPKAELICDKENKWAGHTNWGANTQRGKDNDLKQTKDIKPVPTHSPRNNIWKYVVGKGFITKDKEAHEHPAIFPENLVRDHILTWTQEGDVVLDPFMGSGTTAKMALLSNRNYLGFELSEEYCEIAERRLSKYQSENSDLFE